MNEEVLTGGAINTVTRRGNVVFKTGGPWVPAVHAVLDHLQSQGFPYSPKALGVDDQGREMLEFLPGASMMRPWKQPMFTDLGPAQAASMLRELHDATIELAMPGDTEWRTGKAAKAPGQVIRHGDLGPWNTLWQEDRLTGLIDWDFAEPGLPITDLAQMALYFVPLRGEDHWPETGFPERPDFAHRLEVLCEGYGAFTLAEVVREVDRLQSTEMRRMEDFAAQGLYPWTMFRDNGEIERTRTEVDWLRGLFPVVLEASRDDKVMDEVG
jgi:hypothetical protein